MPRGFVWGAYIDDAGQTWRLRVNADYALEAARGWTEVQPPDVAPLPRGWLPRKVVGVDELGARRSAIVARLDAALWTGGTASFLLEGSDQSFHVCTVTGSLEERRT
jgi:hypothetical protein